MPGKILVLSGSVRRNGNTELLARAFAEGAGKHHEVELLSVADYQVHPCILVIASPVYFYGLSAQLKAVIDRLHTPMRNEFHIRKLGLLLAGAADLPDLFDPIILQYRMILRFFHLEDAGMVLVPGVKDKGDVLSTDGIAKAREMGEKCF